MSAIRVTLWGGLSYGHTDESFPVSSLAQALDMWDDRRSSNGHRKCVDIAADGTESYVYCPCWGDVNHEDGGTYVGMAWYVDDDTDPIGEYPDKVLVLGPRGGLRWQNA
jgi:hypothetical protein